MSSPARKARSKPSGPRVLALMPALMPSTVIAVVKPLIVLHQQSRIVLDVQLERSVSRRRVALADVVVFCRNCEPRYASALDTVMAAAKPYIYVLDDDLFNLPASSEVAAYHHDPLVRRQLEEYVAGAQLVTVFSKTLAKKARFLNPRVETVAGSVDFRLLSRPHPRSSDEPLRIVYATSRRKDDLAQLFAYDLLRLLDRQYPKVEAHVWGCRIPELANHPNVRFVDFIPDYDRYLRRFSRCGFDIGLAPLLDDNFHRSKTNNKYREYGACRIAGIYSDVDVYTRCVQHEVNGLIVSNTPGAWHDAMLRLIEDEPLRERIRGHAFRDVRERYSLESAQDTWWRQIESVLGEWDSSPVTVKAFGDSAPGSIVGSGPQRTAAAPGGPTGHHIARLRRRLATLTRMTPGRAWDGLNRRWSQQYALCKIWLATSPLERLRRREP